MTVAQLREAGLDGAAITRRVRAGRLFRIGRGVYAVGHTALSQEGKWLAEVFKAGAGAALGYLAAARLYEVWRYRVSLIDVVVPRERRVKTLARLHISRNLDPRDVTVFRGIPVTTFARTCVDLTDELTKWELANLLHEAWFRKRLSIPALRETLARANGRRHVKRLEQAITLHENGSAGTRSKDDRRDRPRPGTHATRGRTQGSRLAGRRLRGAAVQGVAAAGGHVCRGRPCAACAYGSVVASVSVRVLL